MAAVVVAFGAGLFCLYMAPSFLMDWMAAVEMAEETVPDVELDTDDGVHSLVHAVVSSVLGVGFLAFAAQLLHQIQG